MEKVRETKRRNEGRGRMKAEQERRKWKKLGIRGKCKEKVRVGKRRDMRKGWKWEMVGGGNMEEEGSGLR